MLAIFREFLPIIALIVACPLIGRIGTNLLFITTLDQPTACYGFNAALAPIAPEA